MCGFEISDVVHRIHALLRYMHNAQHMHLLSYFESQAGHTGAVRCVCACGRAHLAPKSLVYSIQSLCLSFVYILFGGVSVEFVTLVSKYVRHRQYESVMLGLVRF